MKPSLPKGHRDITFEDMARLTFDEDDNLCLDGKPIEVKKMTLTKGQAIFAIMAAIGTTLCGISAAILVYLQIAK